MKRILVLLWLVALSAYADEPGSQYQKAAEAGDARAQYYLADTWFSSRDLSKAEFWAQKSADSGDADACALLAQIKITNPVSLDYPAAKKLAEKAVKEGSKAGEVILARILTNSQGGETDYPRAITLLQQASMNADSDFAVDAQMLLGMIYANGVGVAADDAKAASYFKNSSMLSRTGYAEYWAGMMFLSGEKGFISVNKQKALQWLNQSCTEGFDTGCEEFEKLSNK